MIGAAALLGVGAAVYIWRKRRNDNPSGHGANCKVAVLSGKYWTLNRVYVTTEDTPSGITPGEHAVSLADAKRTCEANSDCAGFTRKYIDIAQDRDNLVAQTKFFRKAYRCSAQYPPTAQDAWSSYIKS